jgi:hypothetical protein
MFCPEPIQPRRWRNVCAFWRFLSSPTTQLALMGLALAIAALPLPAPKPKAEANLSITPTLGVPQ